MKPIAHATTEVHTWILVVQSLCHRHLHCLHHTASEDKPAKQYHIRKTRRRDSFPKFLIVKSRPHYLLCNITPAKVLKNSIIRRSSANSSLVCNQILCDFQLI